MLNRAFDLAGWDDIQTIEAPWSLSPEEEDARLRKLFQLCLPSKELRFQSPEIAAEKAWNKALETVVEEAHRLNLTEGFDDEAFSLLESLVDRMLTKI